jgi:hypothetical protein
VVAAEAAGIRNHQQGFDRNHATSTSPAQRLRLNHRRLSLRERTSFRGKRVKKSQSDKQRRSAKDPHEFRAHTNRNTASWHAAAGAGDPAEFVRKTLGLANVAAPQGERSFPSTCHGRVAATDGFEFRSRWHTARTRQPIRRAVVGAFEITRWAPAHNSLPHLPANHTPAILFM